MTQQEGHETKSNDDCSDHLFTGVKEGTLVRLKMDMEQHGGHEYLGDDVQENYMFPTSHLGGTLDSWNSHCYKGDFFIFLDQKQLDYGWDDQSSIKSWKFTFFHKDKYKVSFIWDMGEDFELDLDVYFEVIETKG